MRHSSSLLLLLLVLPTLATAQLKSPTGFPAFKVGSVEFTRGKVDSMVQQLLVSQYRGKQPPAGAAEQMRSAVVENLVAGELVRQEAIAQGIKPRQSAVDSLEEQMRKQVTAALPDKNFDSYLKQMGYTKESFRKKISDQVMGEQLLEKVAPYPAEPTEAEAKAFFKNNPKKFPVNDSVAGFAIYLTVSKAEKKETIEEKTKFLEGLASQVRIAKADFRMLAAQYSEDPNARQTGGLQEPFLPKTKGAVWVKALGEIKVGEITKVFRDGDKLYLFALAARNDGKYESYRDQILMHLAMEREQERMQKIITYLNELFKKHGVKYYDKNYEPQSQIGSGMTQGSK